MQIRKDASVKLRYRNRVRECRLRAMIATQEELARQTGIHPATLSAIETNRLFLSSARALAIRDVLGCTLDSGWQTRSSEVSAEDPGLSWAEGSSVGAPWPATASEESLRIVARLITRRLVGRQSDLDRLLPRRSQTPKLPQSPSDGGHTEPPQ